MFIQTSAVTAELSSDISIQDVTDVEFQIATVTWLLLQ